jgi:hypothetical protein
MVGRKFEEYALCAGEMELEGFQCVETGGTEAAPGSACEPAQTALLECFYYFTTISS